MSINQITIEGNVGSEPERKFTQDETLVTFSLAHTPWSKAKGEGETMWFRVTFWERKADSVMDNVNKGDKILVQGTLKQSTYTDKEGKVKTSLDITGSYFSMIPRSGKGQVAVAPAMEATPW